MEKKFFFFFVIKGQDLIQLITFTTSLGNSEVKFACFCLAVCVGRNTTADSKAVCAAALTGIEAPAVWPTTTFVPLL